MENQSWEQYLERRIPNVITRSNIAWTAQRFNAWLAGRQATAELAAEWIIQVRATGIKASSEQTYLKAVRHYGTWLRIDLAAGINGRRAEKSVREFFSVAQAMELLKATTRPGLERAGASFNLLYAAGIRLAELLGIRPADLDPIGNTILVRGKGSKERRVPVASAVMVQLQRLTAAMKPDQLVFAVSRETVRRDLRRLVYAAGLAPLKINPHKMRHTFATHMLQGGMNLKALQDILGHQNLSTTEQYVHLSLQDLQQSYQTAHPMARA